jgi:hypothetical protein
MNLPPKYPGHFDEVDPKSSVSEVQNTRYQVKKVKQPTQTFQDVKLDEETFCPLCNNDFASDCPLCNRQVQQPVVKQVISMNQIYENDNTDTSVSYNDVINSKKNNGCKQPAQVIQLPLGQKQQNLTLQQNVLQKCSGKGCLGYGAVQNVQVISTPGVTIDPSVDLVLVTAASPSVVFLPMISSQEDILTKSTITQLKTLTLKNYSLSTHQIKATDETKVDKVLASMRLEPGAKKQLVAAGNTWISI